MRTAICPGSFDPVTKGHLSVITRASKLFDRVIVVVMINPKKPVGCFNPEKRVEFIERCVKNLPNVEVDFYDGLLAEYARIKKADAIVKGHRRCGFYVSFVQHCQAGLRAWRRRFGLCTRAGARRYS